MIGHKMLYANFIKPSLLGPESTIIASSKEFSLQVKIPPPPRYNGKHTIYLSAVSSFSPYLRAAQHQQLPF